MKTLQNREDKPLLLFLAISGSGILFFFLFIAVNQEFDAFRWLVMEHNYDWQFSDFFRQVVYAQDLERIYFNTGDAPFPPLAYCFFHLLWRLNPVEVPIALSSYQELAFYQNNLLLFLMLVVAQTVLLFIVFKKLLCGHSETLVCLFFFAVIFSAPFFQGAIERGNPALTVLILMLLALYCRDSDSAVLREIALLLIAAAAGMKIYPAIFGLLYILEKRWKEAFRLVLYGMALFFLPFAFTGGVDGLVQYLSRILSFSDVRVARWTSIRAFFAMACLRGGAAFDAQMVGAWLEKLFLVLCVLLAFLEKKRWKQLLFLSGIMAVYVPNSYRYTSIYMVIPLVFLFREVRQKEGRSYRMGYLYSVLFAMAFSIPVWAVRHEVDLAIFAPLYLILVIGMVETVAGLVRDWPDRLRLSGRPGGTARR